MGSSTSQSVSAQGLKPGLLKELKRRSSTCTRTSTKLTQNSTMLTRNENSTTWTRNSITAVRNSTLKIGVKFKAKSRREFWRHYGDGGLLKLFLKHCELMFADSGRIHAVRKRESRVDPQLRIFRLQIFFDEELQHKTRYFNAVQRH